MFDSASPGFMNETISEAIQFAAIVHRDQFRKDGVTPYISHPYEVGMVLAGAGCNQREIVAGILHDCIEHGCTEEELAQMFGSDVYSIVKDVTEDQSLPWNERKEHYIAHLQEASVSAALVSAADLLANRADLLKRIRKGQSVWKMFDHTPEERLKYDQQRFMVIIRRIGEYPLGTVLEKVMSIDLRIDASK